MRERGRYQLQLMKTRSSSGVGQKIDLEFNIETLRISDLPEDEQESTNGSSRGSSSIITAIKNRTAAAHSEAPPAAEGRVRATVESSRLRELLNTSFNDED